MRCRSKFLSTTFLGVGPIALVTALLLSPNTVRAQFHESTMLVFADGTRMQVQRYEARGDMIMATNLAGELRGFPRSAIDLEATEAAGQRVASRALSLPELTDHLPLFVDTPEESALRSASAPAAEAEQDEAQEEEHAEVARLSEEVIPFMSIGDIPNRPHMLLELGDKFLGTGDALHRGFTLPGGAVWQPRLWVFGTLRTAFQSFDFDDGDSNTSRNRVTEGVSRFDLFTQLQLTGTEKLIVGIRPLDRLDQSRPINAIEGGLGRRAFFPAGVTFGDDTTRLRDAYSSLGLGYGNDPLSWVPNVRTFFFEGDFGSLFPALDRAGQKNLDYGFSVGRQPLNFQQGIMLNDTVDALGIVRNNLHIGGVSNVRISGVWGWNDLDHGLFNETAHLFGVFTSADAKSTTLDIDFLYILADDADPSGDTFNYGVAATQRFGVLATTFRVNGSVAKGKDTFVPISTGTPIPVSADGTLVTSEVSWTPHGTDDNIYINGFWAIDNFTQAAREQIIGGSLGNVGILFASPTIGNFGSELPNFANDVAGFATGYHKFFGGVAHHTSLAFEAAGRFDARSAAERDRNGEFVSGLVDDLGLNDAAVEELTARQSDIAVGFQLQRKIGRRFLLQFDGFFRRRLDVPVGKRADLFGGRTELLIQF